MRSCPRPPGAARPAGPPRACARTWSTSPDGSAAACPFRAGCGSPRRCAPPGSWRCPRTAPCRCAQWNPARPWSPPAASPGQGGGGRRCPRSPGACAAGWRPGPRSGACGCRSCRRAPPTCRSPPWWRSPARRGGAASPDPCECRSCAPPRRRAGHSCPPGRSG